MGLGLIYITLLADSSFGKIKYIVFFGIEIISTGSNIVYIAVFYGSMQSTRNTRERLLLTKLTIFRLCFHVHDSNIQTLTVRLMHMFYNVCFPSIMNAVAVNCDSPRILKKYPLKFDVSKHFRKLPQFIYDL